MNILELNSSNPKPKLRNWGKILQTQPKFCNGEKWLGSCEQSQDNYDDCLVSSSASASFEVHGLIQSEIFPSNSCEENLMQIMITNCCKATEETKKC